MNNLQKNLLARSFSHPSRAQCNKWFACARTVRECRSHAEHADSVLFYVYIVFRQFHTFTPRPDRSSSAEHLKEGRKIIISHHRFFFVNLPPLKSRRRRCLRPRTREEMRLFFVTSRRLYVCLPVTYFIRRYYASFRSVCGAGARREYTSSSFTLMHLVGEAIADAHASPGFFFLCIADRSEIRVHQSYFHVYITSRTSTR